MVREVRQEDMKQVLELYLHLHEKSIPDETEQLYYCIVKI